MAAVPKRLSCVNLFTNMLINLDMPKAFDPVFQQHLV